MSIVQLVDFNDKNSDKAFTESLRNIGFAVLKDHPIDFQLIETVYDDWYQFYLTDEKYDYPYDPVANIGYVGSEKSEKAKGYDLKDFKEFFHYREGQICPPHLLSNTRALYLKLLELAETLLRWIEKNLPDSVLAAQPQRLWDMLKGSPENVLRILHYPPLTGKELPGTFRAAAHEDINMLTILTAASGSGLEVFDRHSDQWVEVPVRKDWIVVNIGDMLQEVTGGYLPATTHRVKMPEGEAAKQSRLSMPLFLQPALDTVLSDQYTAGSYRAERFKENGLI